MVTDTKVKITLGIVVFSAIYFLPDAFFQADFLSGLGLNNSLLLTQSIYLFASCLFILIFSNFSDSGFRTTSINYSKIFWVVFALQLIPLIGIAFLIYVKGVQFDEWMHLSLLEIIFSYLVLAPIAEEIFVRGLMFSFFEPLGIYKVRIFSTSLSVRVIVTALLFALMHIGFYFTEISPSSLIKTVASLTLLGLVCGYYREKSNSLLPAIYAHALYNFFGVVLFKMGLMFFY